jgi:hypothetical protein
MTRSSLHAVQDPGTTTSGHNVRAPLLTRMIADIDPEERVFIIDLGGLHSGTLAHLQAFRCRLDVLDLDVDSLSFDAADDHPVETLQSRLAAHLPEARGESADLLLCWNFLDYFSRDEIAALMGILLPRLSATARIHALIESSSPDMPLTPVPAALADEGFFELRSMPGSGVESSRRPAPRHATNELIGCMPGMMAEQTLLLVNGQKEFMFRRR